MPALDKWVSASDYGFDPNASGTINRNAILDAVTAANGRPVVVESDIDYECQQLVFSHIDVTLEFRGKGRLLKPTGGVLNVVSSYVDIQSVSAIQETSVTVQGNMEPVTQLTVADSSSYKRGDTIRIVSDDLDPAGRDGYTTRRGECAEVVLVRSGLIYIARSLEDRAYYLENVRVGRLQKKIASITGLRVLSSDANTNPLFGMVALYCPVFHVTVENHGTVVVNAGGCLNGDFVINGSSLGALLPDGNKTIGYMLLDKSGTNNVLRDSVCSRQRHLNTTGFDSIPANSTELHKYGPTRDLRVINCTAESSQNVPFDDHEGARRTQWINCVAKGGLRGTNGVKSAFQLRGTDSRVINPTVDGSYDYVINLANKGRGVQTLQGGRSQCPVVYAGDPGVKPDLQIIDHYCDIDRLPNTGFLSVDGARVTVQGGKFVSNKGTGSSPRFAQAFNGGSITFSSQPEFVLENYSNTASSRMFHVGDGGGTVRGQVICRIQPGTVFANLLGTSGTNGNFIHMDIIWLSGTWTRILVNGSTFTDLQYSVSDHSQTPIRLWTSTQFYQLTSENSEPHWPRELVMHLGDNSTLQFKVRGTDNIVRSGSISLS